HQRLLSQKLWGWFPLPCGRCPSVRPPGGCPSSGSELGSPLWKATQLLGRSARGFFDFFSGWPRTGKGEVVPSTKFWHRFARKSVPEFGGAARESGRFRPSNRPGPRRQATILLATPTAVNEKAPGNHRGLFRAVSPAVTAGFRVAR